MRLGIVTDLWDPQGGGRERYLAGLLPHLRAAGHRVHVLCSRARGSGVEVVSEGSLPAAGLRLASSCDAVLACRPLPGASHAQLHGGLLADAFRADARARGPLHLRLLPLALRLNPRRRALLAEERAMLAGRTRVMVWSEALRERLLDRGVAGERIEVALPGIDLSRFPPAPAPAPAAHLRLLFVAHNPRLKGLLPLLDGLAQARRAGIEFRLRVIGPGAGWHREVAARDLESRVELLGPLPAEAVAAELASSDALLHPTFHDPCSLVALEALACGCPVVTTRANGAAEVAAAAGFLLDGPADAAGLLHALRELADPATRARLRAAGLELRDRLDMAAHARRVTEWLAA